jgi:hypothetical protein
LDAPLQLSLPYTTNTKKRCKALVTRIAKLYEIDQENKPSYKLLRGTYNDGIVKYPFAFEIIAIPFKDPFVDPIKSTEIITAVNYSVSPIENSFEGEYQWEDKDGYLSYARDIRELIHKHGFHSYNPSKARLPSIIVANLVTPRRDPRGHDKSSIDTKPFVNTIIGSVKKMSSGILTNRAAGYRFVTDSERSARRNPFNKKLMQKIC